MDRHLSKAARHLFLLVAGIGCVFGPAAAGPPAAEDEAPRVLALLDQGRAAETGRGLVRSPALAASLYREAGRLGSSEGYYRAALIYLPGRTPALHAAARCNLEMASQLGHLEAFRRLDAERRRSGDAGTGCSEQETAQMPDLAEFDLQGYIADLPVAKQRVAGLIRRIAPHYGIDPELALAIAAVESNFNVRALSPKNAMGVMQLIPDTAERFGVRNPFETEQNIRGGLAYLRWLSEYFGGDRVRIIAAYNAGEGAVDRYGGIPPYPETRAYVKRVMDYSGTGGARKGGPREKRI